MKLNESQRYIVDRKGEGVIVLNAAAGSGKTTTTKETISEMINSGVDPRRILAVTFTRKASREWQERIGIKTIKGWNEQFLKALDNPDEAAFIKLDSNDQSTFEFLNSWCTTIHAACYRLLRKFGDRRHPPTTKDGYKIKDIVNEILDENDWSKLSYKNALTSVGLGVINRIPVHGFAEFIEPILEYGVGVPKHAPYILEEIYKAYLGYMSGHNLIDFNMMLVDWLEMLESNPAVREEATSMFDYIIVDEAQDTSRIQTSILFIMAEKNKNLLFVGDPRQSIYQWRGAVPSIMEEEFTAYWSDFEVRSLPINYRSTKEIIEKSNKVIKRNYEGREMYWMAVEPASNAHDGDAIENIHVPNIESMASQIAERIGDHPEECFILSRTNAECEALHTYLSREGIPCINLSGGSLYSSKNVERLIAYLKLSVNYEGARNDLEILSSVANIASDSFLSPINKRKHSTFCQETRPWIDCGCPIVLRKGVDRAFSRYYGKRSIQKAGGWWGIKNQIGHTTRGGSRIMYSYGAEDLVRFVEELEDYRDDALECIDYILDHSIIPYLLHEEGLDESTDLGESSGMEEFDIVKGFIEDRMTVDEFLESFEEMDFGNGIEEKDAALIMTVHKSKGLERPRVFVNVTRMPCGIPPVFEGQVRVVQKPNFAEERNIFYVAVTRAEEKVYLLQSSTWNSKEVPSSPFIREVFYEPVSLCTDLVPLNQTPQYVFQIEREEKL